MWGTGAILLATPALTIWAARMGWDVGWLVWVAVLPAVIRIAVQRGPITASLLGLGGALPLLVLLPADGLRLLVQVVLPGALAGVAARRAPLRVRDGWWLAGVAAVASVVVGLALGRGDALRDVLLPAGIPTGWIRVVVDKWSGLMQVLALDHPEIFARVATYAEQVEPVLWFGLLVPLMGGAVALVAGPPVHDARRRHRGDPERDLALAVLVGGMAVGVVGRGIWAVTGAQMATVAAIFFLLDGIDVLVAFSRRHGWSRVIELVGLSLLVWQPITLLFLSLLGLGDVWLGWRERWNDL